MRLITFAVIVWFTQHAVAQEEYGCGEIIPYSGQGAVKEIALQTTQGWNTLDFYADHVPDGVEIILGNDTLVIFWVGGNCLPTGDGSSASNCMLGPVLWQQGTGATTMSGVPSDYELGGVINTQGGVARFLFQVPFGICSAKIRVHSNSTSFTVWWAYLHCPSGPIQACPLTVCQWSEMDFAEYHTIWLGQSIVNTQYSYWYSRQLPPGAMSFDAVHPKVLTEVGSVDSIYVYQFVLPGEYLFEQIVYSSVEGDTVGPDTIWQYVNVLPAPEAKDTMITVCVGTPIFGFVATDDLIYVEELYSYTGCDSLIFWHITTLPLPSSVITYSQGCDWTQVILQSPTGSTHLWHDGSSDSIRTFGPGDQGNWIVTITDAQGCVSDTMIMVDIWESPWVDLGPDIVVSLGETVLLHPIYDTNVTLELQPEELDGQSTSSAFRPLRNESVIALVTNPTTGCIDRDTLNIRVESDYSLYVPNVFSPDQNGINDTFHPFSGPDVEKIILMRVFDRWGDWVWENKDFKPNNPAQGWDGNYRGRPMDPAVLAWYLEAKFIDGTTRIFKGDITIVR